MQFPAWIFPKQFFFLIAMSERAIAVNSVTVAKVDNVSANLLLQKRCLEVRAQIVLFIEFVQHGHNFLGSIYDFYHV